MLIIIRLSEISDATDIFPIMNILVISDEQKAAVRGLWHRASLTETAVCLEPCRNVKIISHQRVHHSSNMRYSKSLKMLCKECFSQSVMVTFTVTSAFGGTSMN